MIKGWGKFWNSLRLKNGRGFAILMFTRKGDTKAWILTFIFLILNIILSDQEGEWVDYETRQSPTFEIPWLLISEPTGFTGWFQHNFDSNTKSWNMRFFNIATIGSRACSGYTHFQNIHFLNQKLEYSKTSYSNCKYYF